MTVTKNLLGAVGICTAVFMSGCGGGSGGGSATLPELDVPVAPASVEGGTEAADALLEMSSVAGGIGVMTASASSKKFDPVSYVTKHSSYLSMHDNALITTNASIATNATYSETQPCQDGGSMSFSETYSATSASATIVYDHCIESSVEMNGKLTMSVAGDLQNYILDTEKVSFVTDFTVTYSEMVYTIHQGTYTDNAYSVYDWNNFVFAGTSTSSLWIDIGDFNYRYDDVTVEFYDDFDGNLLSKCFKDGRIYVGDLTGYLDIDPYYDPECSDPFVWNDYLVSGSMELIGSNDSRVHIQADGMGSYTVTVTPAP